MRTFDEFLESIENTLKPGDKVEIHDKPATIVKADSSYGMISYVLDSEVSPEDLQRGSYSKSIVYAVHKDDPRNPIKPRRQAMQANKKPGRWVSDSILGSFDPNNPHLSRRWVDERDERYYRGSKGQIA